MQLARKPEEAAAARQAHLNAAADNENNADGKEGAYRGRGNRLRARGNRSRGQGRNFGEDGTAPTHMQGQALPLTDATNGTGHEGATTEDGGKQYKPRAPRPQRQRGPPEDGVPSKNKVMVANLPFDFSEEKLKDLFSAYQPTSAKIALRPIPRFMIKKLIERNEPRKGRGFGFVTLETEDMQQKAVSEMNGRLIQEREIVVKVAIDSPGKEEAELNDSAAAGAHDKTANGTSAEVAA